jgi:actin-related protein
MYNGFREHNAVAGEDAWYCAYSHPDAGLRGALTVSRPISSQGCVTDAAGFKLLLIHCLGMLDKDNTISEGILVNGTTKVFVSHMLSFSRREFKLLADIVFDHFNFAEMSLLNQPILSSIGFGVPSLIVLDIGAYSTRVMPVYESFCLTQYVETTGIGGEHLTDYMELLLHGQQHEQYSSLLFRRRQQFARELKEKHGFIATSFEECVEMFGMFQFSYEKVMHGANDDKIKCDEGSKTESTKDIEVTASFACADGVNVDVTVDRERFYCPEVLFSPYLYEPCADEASITDIVIASMSGIDESLRNEISRTILVTGNSSQLAGLTDRLQIALSTPMAAFGVENFIVVTTCSPDKQQTVNEMMWKGCANTVSAAKSTQSTLPNLITSVEFEKSGESVFSALSE